MKIKVFYIFVKKIGKISIPVTIVTSKKNICKIVKLLFDKKVEVNMAEAKKFLDDASAQTTEKEAKYDVQRPLKKRGLRTKLAFAVGVAWATYFVMTICKVFFFFDIIIYPPAHRAICAGALVSLAILATPAKKTDGYDRLPWYDILLVLCAAVGAFYIAQNAEDLIFMWGDANQEEIVLAICFSIATIEATRRTVGWAPIILAVVSFLYFMYSDKFPGFLNSTGFSFERAVGWMFLSGEGYWGTLLGVTTTVVPGFILFGAMLRATGGSEFFGNLALAVMGTRRGGPAKTAVIASMLFGSVSGAPPANVATTGQITIPMMKENGYRPSMAAAVEAVASTGGAFTPPIMGSASFLIADFLNISYWEVCVGAFLPAVLFYATLLFQVDAEAGKIGAKGLPRSSLPSLKQVLIEGWYYILPFVVLVYSLGVLRYSAETSIIYTLISIIISTSFSKKTRFTWRKMLIVLEDSACGMFSLIPLCALIGILVGTMTVTGAGSNLSAELLNMAGSNAYLMLLLAGMASFVLGMGMTSLACYLLTVTMLAPALVDSGIYPLSAHLFLFYYGSLSFITPPVAVASFVAASIADSNPSTTGFESMRLGIAAYLVPWVFIANPALLFHGTLIETAFAFSHALVGLILLTSGIMGYFQSPINRFQRAVCIILGILVFIPLPMIYEYSLLGISILVVIWLYGVRQRAENNSLTK